MKYKGSQFIQRNHEVVPIKRVEDGQEVVYEFLVCPPPAGWVRRMKMLGMSDYPSAPKRILKPDGKIIKDATGRVCVEDDEDDPEYIKETSIVSNRLRAIKFVTVLRDDPNWGFESVEPSGDKANDTAAWKAYADSILNELEGSGLTDDEVAHILRVASSIANSAKMEEAMESFLGDPS